MSVYTAVQQLTPNGQLIAEFNPQIFSVASNTSVQIAKAVISGDLDVGGRTQLSETQLYALEVGTTTQTTNLEVYNSSYVPTPQQGSNDNQIANTQYVDNAISNLINSSPELLNTLSEISTAINNDPNFNQSITNMIATKAGLASNNTMSGNNTFTGTITYTSSLNGVNPATFAHIGTLTDDAQEQINNVVEAIATLDEIKANITYVNSQDTQLQTNLNTVENNLQSQITNLGTIKANITYVDSQDTQLQTNLNSVETNLQSQITNLGTTKANITYVDLHDSELQTNIGNLQTNLQSQIDEINQLKANLSYVNSQDTLLQGNLDSMYLTINTTKANITYVDSQDTNLQNALQTNINTLQNNTEASLTSLSNTKADITYVDQSISNLVGTATSIASKANDNEVVHLTGTETIGGLKTFSNNVTVPSLNNISSTTLSYLDATSSIQTQLNSKLGTGTAVDLSTDQTIAGNKTLSGITTAYKFAEPIQVLATVSGNAFTAPYTDGAIFIVTPANNNPNNCNITNIPTSVNNRSYTITLLIDCTTYKASNYVNTVMVNGANNQVPKFPNGTASINASANFVIQTISVIYTNASTPYRIFSTITSFF